MHSSSNELRPLPTGTHVAVRNRYQYSWSNGFEVVRTTEDGYWLRREFDGYLLPRAFAMDDVRGCPSWERSPRSSTFRMGA
jgi:hypothetical protein